MKRIYKKLVSRVRDYVWNTFDMPALTEVLQGADKEDTALLYGLIIEIIRRMTGLTLFDSQIAAAYAMHLGKLAELPTGEGKTLAAVLTSAAAALQGRKVHIFTVNDYLAQRDYRQCLKIYQACGLTCSYIVEGSVQQQKKQAYESDILYITAKQAGFDYLKNFLCTNRDDYLQNPFDMVLIDEADSVLIDEAKIPLVIACDQNGENTLSEEADRLVRKLKACDLDAKTLCLTEAGIKKAETFFCIENLYDIENINLLTVVHYALEAWYKLKRDVDYIVKENKIMVIDSSTGRTPENRRFPALLHRATEIKEGLAPSPITAVRNAMPLQYFVTQYKSICGMSGTCKDGKKSFALTYELQVEVIPPHLPCIRFDHPDEVFDTDCERNRALLEQIRSCHRKGQPVLVGTQSVEESEGLSKLLTNEGIPHHVLNARNDQLEAATIKDAGKAFAVTISTNMAGRGVDIKLDDSAKAAGGLFVFGLGINKSFRIDKQLCGRSGRQGDPGESQFFISFEDSKLAVYPNMNIRQIQKILEGKAAEYRYMLDKYSYIQEMHRQQITAYRNKLLFNPPSTQQKMALYFLNQHWSDYLATMENIRNSIHLVILGGLNPIDEYNKAAISAFQEMTADIKSDLEAYVEKADQLSLKAQDPGKPSATYSYQIDESRSQFAKFKK